MRTRAVKVQGNCRTITSQVQQQTLSPRHGSHAYKLLTVSALTWLLALFAACPEVCATDLAWPLIGPGQIPIWVALLSLSP